MPHVQRPTSSGATVYVSIPYLSHSLSSTQLSGIPAMHIPAPRRANSKHSGPQKRRLPAKEKKKKKKKDPNMQVPPPTQTLIDPFQMRPKWLEQGLGSQGSKEGRKEKKKKTRTPWTWPPLNNQNRACSQPPPRKSCAAAVSYAEPKRPLCVSLFPLQFLDILDKRLLVCLLPPQSVSARRHGFEGTIKGN